MNISETNNSSVAGLFPKIESIYTASYAVNIILGLPTNLYVMWLIVTGAGGTLASEFFILNLTMSEVLFCLFSFVCLVNMNIHITALTYLAVFSFGLLITSRPLFHCCICVERYLAVVHPVIYLKYKPLRYRVGCCGVVWLMVFGSCSLCQCVGFSPVFYFFMLGQSLIYFSLMSFCCLAVLWALKRPGPGDGEREGTNNIKMKAFKIILIIQVYAAVSQLPVAVMAQTKIYLDNMVFYLGLVICFCLSVVTGFVQPLLYLHKVGKLPFLRGL